jgi:hypothetical protein
MKVHPDWYNGFMYGLFACWISALTLWAFTVVMG